MPLRSLPKILPRSQYANLEHERLASLINSMADGVIALNDQMKVVIYNAAALDLLDRNTSIMGKSLSSILRVIEKNDEVVDIEEIVKNAKVPATIRDYRMKYDSDGSIINIYLSIAPVHLGFGKSGKGGYTILLRDITKEKSLEEERDEFISVASHELRTPIAITEGNVSNAMFILKNGGSLDEINKALEATHKQIMFLTDLINDLSTLSRAERGKLPVDLESINVHDLATELSENYRPDIEKKGLVLRTELDPKLELLYSSKLYVREILQNFITNAIKYTSSGQIELLAKPKEDGVLFEVTDSGIGISKSDQAKVFSKFFRSEDYRTRQSSGTGLGLYVTQKLAALIQAQITMRSKLNDGSTFSIFVPNLKSNHP
jgi:PAS domain S-box-containing protein